MLTLGIESSCDETACAVVRAGKEILSNCVASQADLHAIYGGVVPELACRRHIDVIIPLLMQALDEASVTLSQIDLIAVANTPGLIGALMIGLTTAKALALAQNIPFIGVNHVAAHLYATLMEIEGRINFPALGLVISGGHTALLKLTSSTDYQLIGRTLDDAVGEAFDKAAKILGLPYPGGPNIEKLALSGDPALFSLKAGQIKGRPLDFSFSGLKTGVLYASNGIEEEAKPHLAAAFQETALTDLVKKSLKAAKQEGLFQVIVGGGVSCNRRLRGLFSEIAPELEIFWPDRSLALDNAAMIAGMGSRLYAQNGRGDPLDLEAVAIMQFST